MTDRFADVQQSLNRCLRQPDFLRRFYTVFMNSDPRIARKFDNTDLEQQIHMLRHGLSCSIAYASGSTLGTSVLDRIGRSHSSRGSIRVEPWMYQTWLDSLLQAVRETDPELDERLEKRWREALGKAIDYIRSAA